jgi:hypothetical protein
MARLVRTNARGEREHLGPDGWFVADHAPEPSRPIAPDTGLGATLQEPLKLAPDVSPDLTVRDTLAPIIGTDLTLLLSVISAHDAPPSEPEPATLDFAELQNVDR